MRVVLPILAAANDLSRVLERFQPLPDMRMLAVGLLSAGYKSLCELDWRGAGRRVCADGELTRYIMAGKSVAERHKTQTLRHEMAMMKLDEARVAQTMKMFEALPVFAQDIEGEKDWVIVGTAAGYTEQQLDNQRIEASKHTRQPAGRNILQTMQDFVIGTSASIDSEDENPEVQEYWDGWAERNDFDLTAKEIVRRTIRDGEMFNRWFDAPNKEGDIQMRFVRPNEIAPSANSKPTYGISVNPDDYKDVKSYHRKYTTPGNVLKHDTIPAKEMDHVKIGVDSDVKRGVSFFNGIGHYMTEYNLWIKDRIKLNRIRHFFNVVGEPTSGATAISDMKAKMPDVSYSTPPTGKDKKKQAVRSGSVLFTKGVKWSLQALKINANDTKEDGRLIQLMISLGTNIPEYITRADASNANYSSSMVAESPFVRAMQSWQHFFKIYFKALYRRVIADAIERGLLKKESKKTTISFDAATQEDVEKTETVDTSTECTVNFAALIHRDIEKETKAVSMHLADGLVSKKTAAETFDYDYDAERDQMARELKEEEAEELRRQELFGMPDKDGFPGENDDDET